MLRQFVQLDREVTTTKSVLAQRAKIEADLGLDKKAKRQQLLSLSPISTGSNDRCSIFVPPFQNTKVVDIGFLDFQDAAFGDVVDLAFARLDPFDPASVTGYPVFKNPSKDFVQGTSLCKLGFPFHSFQPTYDEAKSTFLLPKEALPMPRFPIEGIFTRQVEVEVPDLPEQLPFPIRYVETSTPGLRGQSGGPTFDVQGRLWALQAKTQHYPLGFDPQIPGGKKNEREHQFLNVGLGVHAETIIGILNLHKIDYEVSAD
jgi:hypothetical protein